MMLTCVEVRLKQPNKRIDTIYDYAVSSEMAENIQPGMRVVVPFGTGSRVTEGMITAVKDGSEYEDRLKSVLKVIDAEPVLTKAQLILCDWMCRYYCSLYYEALAHFTAPVRVIRKRKKNPETDDAELFQAYAKPLKTLTDPDDSENAVPDTADWGASELFNRYRDFTRTTTDSKGAFFAVREAEQRFDLYCRIAAEEMRRGRQTIILYPEVVMTQLRDDLFQERFKTKGVICHGRLTPASRYTAYERMRTKEAMVAMGTGTALFLPAKALGTVIIDSPGDSSYYAQSMPHYEILKTAAEYCRLTGGRLIIGGDMVNAAVYSAIRKDRITLISDQHGQNLRPEIIDMQAEMRRGNLDFVSRALQSAIEDAFYRNEKVLLMLNRKGYATHVFCRDCGYTEKCPTCGVSMKVFSDGLLRCPYCGRTKKRLRSCPKCGSGRFRTLGIGVEQADALLRQRYPDKRFLRIDGETVKTLKDYREIAEIIASRDWDAVIGTRLLLKDFDFGRVDLTAALLTDGELNSGDFSASEKAYLIYRRFFNLSDHKAIAQTYQCEHPVMEALQSDRESDFWEQELRYRKMLGYPPESHMVIFSVMEENAAQAAGDAETLFDRMNRLMAKSAAQNHPRESYRLYRPNLAGIQPVTGRIRYMIVLKLNNLSIFHHAVSELIASGGIETLKSRVSVEVNPPTVI